MKSIPEEIQQRAHHDPIVYAACHRYLGSDMTLEQFLIGLVVVLSDVNKTTNERMVEMLANAPQPRVVIRR